QQVRMPFALFLDPLVRGYQEQRGACARSPSDHVFQEFFVPRCINDDVRTGLLPEPDLPDVDRDVLVPFRLQGIHEKRPFKLPPAPAANGLDLLELPFRQRAGVMQKPANQSRFTVIDMADYDNPKGVSA